MDEFCDDFLITLNPFVVQDPVKTFEKACRDLLFLFSFNSEINDGTSAMEWFNDFVFVIAGKNKSAVSGELLNTRSKKELYVGSGIVCFIDDDDFMLRLAAKRDSRGEVLGIIPNGIKKPSFIRSINDINIYS